MIGRFASEGTFAQVGPAKIAQVAAAGLFIIAAVAARSVGAGEAVVIGLCLASLSLTGFPIIWEAIKGLTRLETNVDELVRCVRVSGLARRRKWGANHQAVRLCEAPQHGRILLWKRHRNKCAI